MIYKARAPLRIGLAGGGTDINPYCDIHGGCILNATINLYAYATITPRKDGKIKLIDENKKESLILDSSKYLEINENLNLLKGVYNKIIKNYIKKPLSFTLSVYVDVNAGSGLGSSSALIVAILKAFQEWQNLNFSNEELAYIGWEIERKDLKMHGGKQDSYCAAFGGFNFMTFNKSKTIIEPLKIKSEYIKQLESNLILYNTKIKRLPTLKNENSFINTSIMHNIKRQAYEMKEALVKGNLKQISIIMNENWENKRKTSSLVSSPKIDNIYKKAIDFGASAGKICGSGGGGFFIFYCPDNSKNKVCERLSNFNGEIQNFKFTKDGAESKKIKV